MRLKEDNTSWKSGGIKHRDNRHDKSVEDVPKHKAKKKNKKKWCKGKEGRKHVLIFQKSKYGSWRPQNNPLMEVACGNCGKVLDVDWGFGGCPKKGREAMLEEWNKKLGYK